MNYDPQHAPDHHVRVLASVTQPPRRPHGGPTPEQWTAQIRDLVDRIWAEAFFAGAGYGLSIQPPRPILMLDQSDGKVRVEDEARLAERVAEREDLMGPSWHEAARRTRDLIEANANKDGTIDPVYRSGEVR